MKPPHRSLLGISLLAFVILVPVARVRAQAGLSGNALEGQSEEMRYKNSSWDKGLKSKSALGQLEELSGGKVDRSSTPSSQYRTSAPKKTLSSRQQFNNMMRQELATTLVEALLTNILFDDSAARAKAQAAAAAKAAEEARIEAERQAKEARLAREEFARNLRAAWDMQDEATAANLAGAFDVGTGTAFFGSGSKATAEGLKAIDAEHDTDDSTPVDLSGSDHPAVNPMDLAMTSAGGVGLTTGPAMVPPSVGGRWVRLDDPAPAAHGLSLTPHTAAEEAALHAVSWYGDTMKGAVTDSLVNLAFGKVLQRLDNLPGMDTAKAFWEFKEKYEELSSPLQTKVQQLQELFYGGSQQAARLLGSRRLSDGGFADSYSTSLESLGGEMGREFRGMAFKEAAGQTIDAPDFGPAEEIPLEDSAATPLLDVTKGLHGYIHIRR